MNPENSTINYEINFSWECPQCGTEEAENYDDTEYDDVVALAPHQITGSCSGCGVEYTVSIDFAAAMDVKYNIPKQDPDPDQLKLKL